MCEEKLILTSQCHRVWTPVFFGSFIFVYGPLACLLSDGSEAMASIYVIGAMLAALLTAPIVDAIYFGVRDHFIMKRYYKARAEEAAMDN
jgi:hypothetical protein